MKKHIILSALAAAMLCACSSDEVLDTSPPQPQCAISFEQPFVTPGSRAVPLSKAQLQSADNGKFAVWAYMNEYDQTAQTVTSRLIMSQVPVYYNKPAAPNAWWYQNTQYWVADRYYKFFALASTLNRASTLSFNMPTTCTSWGNTAFRYTVSTSEAFCDDLAYATEDRTMPSSIATQPAPVSFTFNHVLAQVVFIIEDHSLDAHRIEITDQVRYTGYGEGSFMLLPNQSDKTRPSVTWTLNNASTAETSLDGERFNNANNDRVLFSTIKQSDGQLPGGIFVIPNTTGTFAQANNGTLAIPCRMIDVNTGTTLIEKIATAKINANFEPGHSYQVKVKMQDLTSGFPIDFDITDVTPFVNDPTVEITQ